MDVTFDLETLLCSYEFRKKLNESLKDKGLMIRVALVDPLGRLVLGTTPGISPFNGERVDAVQPTFDDEFTDSVTFPSDVSNLD